MTSGPFLDLDTVRARVAAYEPRAKPDGHERLWAATALIIAPGRDGPVIAFIQRPSRAGDVWSGQMALPGGKRDAADRDALVTAIRETREEVGVDLPAPVARLDDVEGHVHSGVVATYAFILDERPLLRPAPAEVAAALWIPLRTLLSAESAFPFEWTGFGHFPALRHNEYVIWGLTHRILGSFAHALGLELPLPEKAE